MKKLKSTNSAPFDSNLLTDFMPESLPPPPLDARPASTLAENLSADGGAEERENAVEVIAGGAGEPVMEEVVEEEDDGDDEEEDEEDEGDEEGGEEEEDEREMEQEKPFTEALDERAAKRQKLAEGFYEVEAIRKRRICKGEPLYLIKWRGWPESANTWEPVEHLQTCPDVVDAYEQRLLSGQKSSRKRRRKFTQPKKKMHYSYSASKSKLTTLKSTLVNEPHNSVALDKYANIQTGMVEVVVQHDEGSMRRSKAAKKADCNGSETVSPHLDSNEQTHGTQSCFPDISEGNLDSEFQHVPVEGVSLENYQLKPGNEEIGQGNQQRGAKRRKSGSVRRFTQDVTSFNLDYAGNALPGNTRMCNWAEQPILGNSDGHRKKKFDNSRNSVVITKLIKPISYSASVTNNIQDVSVTFVAMRSDGMEVMVDNKFLKANYPDLLINFYEQHLRYNP